MSATPQTVLVRSFWNFADVFVFIKMYMWFGHYRQIIFSHFFPTCVNLFIFRYLRCNEWLLCERNSFHSISSIFLWNFTNVLFRVCKCEFGLGIIVKVFYSRFQLVNLVNFWYLRCNELVLCKCNSSYNFSLICLILCLGFVHGLKMYMWFGD